MQHLTLEALARLVDETPAREEAAHLERCEACQEELEALRAQTRALASLPTLMPAPDRWTDLRRRLRAEGVITGGRRRWAGPTLTRVAAALALFLAGGATGFIARGTPTGAPDALPQDPPARTADATGAGQIAAPALDEPAGASAAVPVSAETLGQEVERTEEMFAAALDRYMRASGTDAPDPAARLAALDHIVLTTAEALNTSPADPVINSYHLTAVAQRDQLLRQLAADAEPVF